MTDNPRGTGQEAGPRTGRPTSHGQNDRHHSGPGQRHDRPRTTVTNTNYAGPGAYVGSQHDVIEGPVSFHFGAGDDGDVTAPTGTPRHPRTTPAGTHHTDRARHRDTADHRATRNTASDGDHVAVQIGLHLGDIHYHRDTD
ncbi:hypothetical protein [Saccharothrix stipae]